MPEGSAIELADVRLTQWPAGAIPAGAYSSIEMVVGRVTRLKVFKGDAMVPGRLARKGTVARLAIPRGKRAIGVLFNDLSGGLIQPDSRVDILLVRNGGTDKSTAKLFMENRRVLAIGPVPRRRGPSAAAVAALEVTPAEAERVASAAARGELQLVLRGVEGQRGHSVVRNP